MKILAALLILGTAWAGSPRITPAPQADGSFRVGARWDGPGDAGQADICSLRQPGSSVAVFEWEPLPSQPIWFEVVSPAISGIPDMLLMGYCSNEYGDSVASEKLYCLDAAQDCERQCGDVHFDYKISLADFAQARRIAALPDPTTDPDEPWCDVTGDQACTLADFVRIRERVAGNPQGFEQYCRGVVGP